jgi:signal transduction histidine kinase/CheY-like chemotaxis protein
VRHVRPLRDALLASAAVLLMAAVLVGVMRYAAADGARDGVSAELENLAAAAATVVDVSQHEQLHRADQLDTPSYEATVAPLRRILRSNPSIRYVYTFRATSTGVSFVVDASPPGDHDADGREDRSGVHEAYDEAPAALREMLTSERPTASQEPYTDAWGTFMAGFAPLRDPAGRVVGGVAVEITAARYQERMAFVQRTVVVGMGTGALAALIIGVLVWRLRTGARRAELRLEDTLAQLEAAVVRASQATIAKSAFLANMSHEIRTPMNGVIATLELLVHGDLSADQRSLLDTTRRSSEALLKILDDILDLSKIEAGKLDVRAEPVDLGTLAEDVVELFTDRAEGQGIEVSCVLGDGVPATVLSDAVRLRQILMNLVGNAVKFTEHGEVTLTIHRPSADAVVIEVRDTGVGIPPDQLARLGEAFVQADQSFGRRFQGTGLGLAISLRLAELLGARLSLGSVHEGPETGTCATLTIPVAPTSPRATPACVPATPVHVAMPPGARRARLVATLRDAGAAVSQSQPTEPAPPEAVLVAVLPVQEESERLAELTPRLAEAARVVLLVPRRALVTTLESVARYPHVEVLPQPVRRARLLETLATTGPTARVSPLPEPTPSRALDVLLVEDNITNLRLTRMMLERLSCRVTTALDGQQALDRLAERRFDLVFMDCQMPQMDGFEAVRQWRAREPAARRTPVIALTANAFVEDRQRSLDAGMDDHLTKPVRLDALREALTAWARTAAA